MAGSWRHSVAEDGQLLKDVDLAIMLETGGDVAEYAEEAFGMVWFLASELAAATGGISKDLVEEARARYHEGLAVSPGTQGYLRD